MSGTRAGLARAYRNTEYRVQLAGGELCLQIDRHAAEQDASLRQAGVLREYALVTPCNPGSVRLCATENEIRLLEFRAALRAAGCRWQPAIHRDPQGRWPDEAGALLLDCSVADAAALGRRFGQNAVVHGRLGRAPQLIWLLPQD